jgi:hypothetical protein
MNSSDREVKNELKIGTLLIAVFVPLLTSITYVLTSFPNVRNLSVEGNIVEATHNADADGWAVLLEMNDFPEEWSNIPVNFINSERMRAALLRKRVELLFHRRVVQFVCRFR